MHTGEKPYKCKYEGCLKSFKAQGHLKNHTKKHLEPKVFFCKFCQENFLNKILLKNHYLNVYSKRIKIAPRTKLGKKIKRDQKMEHTTILQICRVKFFY